MRYCDNCDKNIGTYASGDINLVSLKMPLKKHTDNFHEENVYALCSDCIGLIPTSISLEKIANKQFNYEWS